MSTRPSVRRERLMYLLSPIGLLVLWEILIQAGIGDRRFVPAPSDIAERFYQLIVSGELPNHVAATLWRIAVGYVIGVVPAVAIGPCLAMSPGVRVVVDPLSAALFPMPKVAVMPLVLVAVGFWDASEIA